MYWVGRTQGGGVLKVVVGGGKGAPRFSVPVTIQGGGFYSEAKSNKVKALEACCTLAGARPKG